MTRFIVRILSVAILLVGIALAGLLPAQSDTSKSQTKKLAVGLSYRSRAPFHKVIVYAEEQAIRDRILSEGGSIIEDYGAFALLRAAASTIDRVSAQSASAPQVRDDMNVLLLRAGAFDTTQEEPQFLKSLDEPEQSEDQLYLVQMVGPAKQEWYDVLEANAQILSYIPNNAYLVRASEPGIRNIEGLKTSFVQWSGLYKPAYKIAPEIAIDSDRMVAVTVQLARNDQTQGDIYRIASFSSAPMISDPMDVLGFTNIRLIVPASRLTEVARMSNVVWVEPYVAPELFDERQSLILSGNVTGAQLGAPGYLNWLRNHGITSSPDFLVDVADTGIDKGNLDPEVLHKDFLNAAGLSRVIYARLMGQLVTEGPANDTVGHGTLDAAIVGGFNTQTDFPFVDLSGYSLGLGVHPFARLGISKIFVGRIYTNPNLNELVDFMYRDGARISSNSWGADGIAYNVASQTYDALVRDARPSESGNQEITVVFASGNKGADTLSTPATAKNVLTVGASENIRPGVDGCLYDGTSADDSLSIIDFSSGALTLDGRVKPEIVAPGTHIQAAASQDPLYNGEGVCGPKYFPAGQTLYTWSSGTSHSTPAVSGAAAIVRQFFQQATGKAPSPAMVKAFLTNSTTYMTGAGGGGNLPGTRQGWGLLNIGRALDETPKQIIDQTQVLGRTGDIISVRGTVADPTKPFRITLAWTDAPGAPSASPVVNNLDLEVAIGGVTFRGNNFLNGTSAQGGVAERLNNVESVWLPQGASGDFTIRIIGAEIAGDGVPGNSDTTDQDFALVVYNGRGDGGSIGGGGGTNDPPPTVTLKAPLGGERLMAGNLVRISWDADDNKQITSQKVEFSSDQGVRYDVIASFGGNERSFDWKIPAIPTTQGRIRITVLDGVNLPVSSSSPANFEIVTGPPDTTPPLLQLVSPNNDSVLGGGLMVPIKWKESDNIGVIRRVIEFSIDNGATYQAIATIIAPSSGQDQTFDWQVPASLETTRGKIRMQVFDGSGNMAEALSPGKFDVWPLPIINDIEFDEESGPKGQIEVFGRFFRKEDCEVFANGKKLKKLLFTEQCGGESGFCRKISSNDPKIKKRVKVGKITVFVVRIKTTGQESPEFSWKRRK